jgi:hypothetical protein
MTHPLVTRGRGPYTILTHMFIIFNLIFNLLITLLVTTNQSINTSLTFPRSNVLLSRISVWVIIVSSLITYNLISVSSMTTLNLVLMDGTWLVSNWKLGMELFICLLIILILPSFGNQMNSGKMTHTQTKVTPQAQTQVIYSSKPEIYIMVLANLAGLSC